MRKLIEVPYFDQSKKYPTGCESVTAVMLLHFLGFPISIDSFIADYLDKQDMQEVNGQLYGPDPWKCFAGSPYDEDSFGCYAPVIKSALEKILPPETYQVVDETGAELEDIVARYIDNDMPVALWACINMREPITGPVWKLLNPDKTSFGADHVQDHGRGKCDEFIWISNEHCMLLVGYDEENYYFNDPYDNNGVIGYKKEVVKNRYKAQHSQAVGVQKK